MAVRNRTWEPVETRLLSEFLAVRYPAAKVLTRVRLGSVDGLFDLAGLDPAAGRMVGVWRRWLDALIVERAKVTLVEAAVVPDPGDISQLDLYMELLPRTPELVEYRQWRRDGLLVYAVDDPVIRDLAARRGYAVEIFRPGWVDSYMGRIFPRKRRAPLTVEAEE